MLKPQTINEFEKLFMIPLTEIRVIDELYNNRNSFLCDNERKVIGLNLSNNSFRYIAGLDIFKELKFLDLSRNKIREIGGLKKLNCLEELYLSGNNIIVIRDLNNLKNLRILDISLNRLDRINELNSLNNLKTLDLAANLINKIEGLKNLINLQNLDLSENEISSIEGLESLINLQNLDLSLNRINRIEGLEKLINLQNLDLSGNEINRIEGLEIFIKLKSLIIHRNPFLNGINLKLDDDINANHLDAIISYLKKKEEEGQIKVKRTAKVLFLGNHASGKSTFADYFLNEKGKRKINENIKSTHILNIHQYQKDNNNIPKGMIYDFGGQDYYHGIYRAFLTNDSVNIIFWQLENDRNQIRMDRNKPELKTQDFNRKYWLHQLAYFYDKNNDKRTSQPVMLVQTHADKPYNERETIRENCETLHVENEFFISLSDNALNKKAFAAALNYFEQSLIEKIEEKQNEEQQPQWYIDFLNFILTYNKAEHISLNDLRPYYNRKEEKDYLSVDLVNLSLQGMVMYYHKNEILKDIVWLNPSKTVETIHFEILNSKLIVENKGRVNVKDFEAKVNDVKIIELLKLHKVIFLDETDAENKEYIIPGYLPLAKDINEEYFILSDFEDANLILKFENFIPFGFINQLICTYGKNPEKKLYWRDQLLFTSRDRKAKVLIQLDFEHLEIKITIKAKVKSTDIKEVERELLDNIIDIYWGHEITDKKQLLTVEDNKSIGFKKNEPILFKNFERIMNRNISDLYLSIENFNFIHLPTLDDSTLTTKEIIAYPLKKKSRELDKQNGRKINPVAYRHLSINNNLNNMKKIFVSYSKYDESYLKEFDKNLINLKDEGLIDVYYDKLTDLGDDIHKVIGDKLKECDYMISLVSIDYLNTKYIREFEINVAEELGKKIIPIIIKPCEWERSKMGKYYASLKGTVISLDKDKFLNDQIKETTTIERQAWWTELIRELRAKIF